VSEGATWLQTLLGGATDIARDYMRQEVRVQVRTNILPAITVYSGNAGQDSQGSGLAKLLGIKAGLVVTGADGRQLLSVGQPSSLDPIRAGLLLLAVGGLVFVIVRGIRS
jgi:hypothetical protein